MEEPKEDHNDPGLLGRIAQRFMNKFPVLQTRSGRAGRVHNYLRGLGLAFAPVPFGESPSFAELKAKSNELFFLKRKKQSVKSCRLLVVVRENQCKITSAGNSE